MRDFSKRPDKPCPQMASCPMFELFSLAGALGAWKINYCTADYARCQRYQRSSQGRHVPQALLPNGTMLPHRGSDDRNE